MDDLIAHSRDEKENIGSISHKLLSASIKSVFNGRSKCVRIRKHKRLTRVYKDLKRKNINIEKNKVDLDEEWHTFYNSAETITATAAGKWCVCKDEFSLSFIPL